MQLPLVYISKPHYSITEDGKRRTDPGLHGIFAAEVLFIPSFLSADFVGSLAAGASRFKLAVDRQIRFIHDLATVNDLNIFKEYKPTFDVRFIFRPSTTRQPTVQIFFLGKISCPGKDQNKIRQLALELWQHFCSHFPLEDPFNYPLIPVNEAYFEERQKYAVIPLGDTKNAFEEQVLTPIPLDSITTDKLWEIRKFEDWDDSIEKTLGVKSSNAPETTPKLGYFVHCLRPTLDVSGFSRLLETLMQQNQTCLVRISLRPTALTNDEIRILNRLLAEYEHQWHETEGWVRNYKKTHLGFMQEACKNLMSHKDRLFSLNIQVIGDKERPREVVAALGSELMNNSATQSQRIKEVRPTPDDLEIAKANLCYLEHELWGTARGPTLRMPILVNGYEAAGAFRLPIPSESGYMPGISVRDEPFVQPQGQRQKEAHILLGDILHRGTKSGEEFSLLRDDLHRHLLIAGSTGTGKTNTCLYLLSQLWKTFKTPFLVIYPVAKTDYRLLMADPWIRDDLLVLTAGDRPSPLCFNLFDIPEGILLRTHISNMMRTFETGMYMWPTLRMLFREALWSLYEDHGWNVDDYRGSHAEQKIPILVDFLKKLKQIVPRWAGSYNAEVRGDLLQDSEKKIQDLLLTADSVLNVCYTDGGSVIEEILKRPAIIEVGRVGSASDIALVVGFLVTLLSEHVISRHQKHKPGFQLTEHALERLKDERIPDKLLNELHSLKNREFTNRKAFLNAVGKHIGKEHTTRYAKLILKYAEDMALHVTLIEEAHRVMSAQVNRQGEHMVDPRIGGAEDFAQILSEVRGFGEAIMIAEQTPTKLIPDAIANTHVKIMHWLEDHNSFTLFTQLMNLNERQQQHVRTLEVGEVIVRTASGYPVQVKIPDYKEIVKQRLLDTDEKGKCKALQTFQVTRDNVETFMKTQQTDENVEVFMQKQIQRLEISMPEYAPWKRKRASKAASAEPKAEEIEPIDLTKPTSNQEKGRDARFRKAREERLRKIKERRAKS